ncbi:MAG: PAS domain S-box protein [Methanoregula sp.]|nr:PAS domain S-box protein [Methanoregula sp.]
MKIKTQVSISIIVFVILAVVITSSYFSSANQLSEIQKKQQIIDNIEKSSFELYYLENDYILHGGPRTVERWNAKYAELTGQLSDLTLTDPSQQAVLDSLLNSHADLQTTFLNLVVATVSVQGTESVSADQKVKEFAASTLTGHIQMTMASSSELSQMVKTEAIEVEQRTTLIVSSSILVLMVFVLLNYLLINRSVLRSISALGKGAGRIGSGDLDTTIENVSNDELGDLSLAITAMASNLKTVLTSKSELEKEVAERKQAELALYSVNEDLTAIEEELRTNLDELTLQEQVVRESEGVLRSILDSTPAGVGLLVNQVLQKVNHSLCKLTGYSEEEIIGQSSRMLYPDNDEYLRVGRELYGQMERYGLGTVEARLMKKDGAIIIVMLSMCPFDPQNLTVGVTATALDITDRKRDEDALRQANKKLNLLSGITRHDINNQLLVLNGFLTLLQKKATDPAFQDFFTRITNASSRISAMIQFTKEYELIGVHAPTWQDCRTIVDTAAKQAPLGMVMVENDLPADMTVFADQLITKVYYNLMDNAVRYGGKITTIRFSALKSGDDHLILCEDDGEGIRADEKEKIFERGYGKNTGLGLALSREILSISGITIKETGEPGKGARFEMRVPEGMWRRTGEV